MSFKESGDFPRLHELRRGGGGGSLAASGTGDSILNGLAVRRQQLVGALERHRCIQQRMLLLHQRRHLKREEDAVDSAVRDQ